MLTEKEQHGIRAILDKLKSEDLYSLTFTVTKGFIKPENREEAAQAILLYCEKPSLLLRRKKVKKEIIFSYLRDEGVIVSVTGEKSDYIKSCLQFWMSSNQIETDVMDDSIDDATESHTESRHMKLKEDPVTALNPYATFCSLDPKEVVMMGQDFVAWFYDQLSRAASNNVSEENFLRQMFMEDCSMNWLVQDVDRVFTGTVNSAAEAIQVTTELFVSNMLVLRPGVEGVQSSYTQYGIVQVSVGGVVYRVNQSIGLFQQLFGLFRDPFHVNCWRVKRTDLKMQVNVSFTQLSRIESQRSLAIL